MKITTAMATIAVQAATIKAAIARPPTTVMEVANTTNTNWNSIK